MMFKPECITISLGHECNQRCLYCYAPDHTGKVNRLADGLFVKAIAAAVEITALSCREKNLPLSIGFQGSGEPLIHFDMLKEIYGIIRSIASKHSLAVNNFITSNGTLEPDCYEWLADNFRRICISFDGVPEIHAALRPALDGTDAMEKTREVITLLQNRGNMPVGRMTATKIHGTNLSENIRYLIDEIGFSFVQVEPAYRIDAVHDFSPDPEIFALELHKAQEYALKKKAVVFYSGYRPGEKHSVYCNILRNVLFINPAGISSACLFQEPGTHESLFSTGYYSEETDSFIIDDEKIRRMAEVCRQLPDECSGCAVSEHCTKGCPDVCLLRADKGITGSVRCRINKLLYSYENH